MDTGSPTQLIDKYGGENKIIVRSNAQEVRDKIHDALFEMGPLENADGDIVISDKKGKISRVIELLEGKNIPYSDIITQRPTLEDVFISLTGEALTSTGQEEVVN